jgi:RNA polymerase subunit RPABC4/transcription elongation factor Spt4
MAFCVNCGTKIEDGTKFCPGCGTPTGVAGVSTNQGQAANTMQPQPAVMPNAPQNQSTPMADEKYCFSCGAIIKKAAAICPKCGVDQSSQSSTRAANVYCFSCGRTISRTVTACPFCGVTQSMGANASKLALASLIIGLVSIFISPVVPIFSIFIALINGLVFGIQGLKSTEKNRRSYAIGGIIASCGGIIMGIFVAIMTEAEGFF